MPSQGPLSPTITADDSALGVVAWLNSGNCVAADGSVSTSLLTVASLTSHYIVTTGYAFRIPTGAIIRGVQADVARFSAAADESDYAVRLVVSGAIGTTDRASASLWPVGVGNQAYATYGGAADLWGATLSPAIVNASDFGFALAGQTAALGGLISIDHIRLTVTFALPSVDPANTRRQALMMP